MRRFRLALVPLLLAAAGVAVCGTLLLMPVRTELEPDERLPKGYIGVIGDGIIGPRAVGWPWVFVKTTDGVGPNLTQHRIVVAYHPWMIAADVAVLLTMLAAAAVVAGWHYWQRRSWFHFSLRELFSFVTVVVLACGWWSYKQRGWQRERDHIAQFQFQDEASAVTTAYTGPQWLRRFCDCDEWSLFRRAVLLHVNGGNVNGLAAPGAASPAERAKLLAAALPDMPFVDRLNFGELPLEQVDQTAFSRIAWLAVDVDNFHDDALNGLSHWPRLRILVLSSINAPCPISDPGLAAIGRCTNLQELTLWHASPNATDIGMAEIGRLTQLRTLDLLGSRVSDEAIAHFSELHNLRKLELTATEIGDRALEALSKLPALECLRMADCKNITDAGVAHLTGLKRPLFIDLAYTNITDEAVESLASMPTLEEVDLSQCGKLTERSVRCLLQMANLKTVYFLGSPALSPETTEMLNRRTQEGLSFQNAELSHLVF